MKNMQTGFSKDRTISKANGRPRPAAQAGSFFRVPIRKRDNYLSLRVLDISFAYQPIGVIFVPDSMLSLVDISTRIYNRAIAMFNELLFSVKLRINQIGFVRIMKYVGSVYPVDLACIFIRAEADIVPEIAIAFIIKLGSATYRVIRISFPANFQ